MSSPSAGWFDDGSGRLRWWNGTSWTDQYADQAENANGGGAPKPANDGRSGSGRLVWIVIVVVIGLGLLMIGMPGILMLLGIAAVIVGVLSLAGKGWSRVRIASRPIAVGVLMAGIVLGTVGGVAAAASRPGPAPIAANFAEVSGSPSTRASHSPSPSPTPRLTETIVEERSVIPYTSSTIDDPNLDVGVVVVSTPGSNGEKLTRTRVISEGGKELRREVVEEIITVPVTNEVISNGTRVPPPPAPVPFAGGGGCDPNYEGACVPISSDVDCSGGSGNGPDYVDGPVWIVGSDIYDLDRDGDGIACDT